MPCCSATRRSGERSVSTVQVSTPIYFCPDAVPYPNPVLTKHAAVPGAVLDAELPRLHHRRQSKDRRGGREGGERRGAELSLAVRWAAGERRYLPARTLPDVSC
eukprot:238292-Rhodomonas_salina.1